MKTKIIEEEGFLKRHKYALLIFIFIFFYNFFFVNGGKPWQVDGYAYTFHLVDFSVGFHTEVLPGAIFYGLFKDHITQEMTSGYVFVLMVAFMLMLSVLLERVAKNLIKQQRMNALLLVLFFIVGQYTASDCFYWFGFFDMYLFFLSILFFVCVENRYGVYFVPIIYLLSVLTHFSSFLTCIPMFTIVLIFKMIQEKEAKKKSGVILVVSLVLTISLGVYLLLFESENLNYTIDQFHTLLAERGGANYRDELRAYYDYAFYHTVTIDAGVHFAESSEALEAGLSNLIEYVVNYIKFNFDLMKESHFLGGILPELAKLFISIPFFLGYAGMVVGYLLQNRLSDKKSSMRVPLFLTFLHLPIALIAMLFSSDISRWGMHVVAILAAEALYFISKDCDLLNAINRFIDKYKPWAIAYLFVTATTVF